VRVNSTQRTLTGLLTDPEVIRYVAEVESFYPPTSTEGTVEENRALYDRMSAAFRVARPSGLTVRDFTLPARDPDRDIPLRAYNPEGGAAPSARLVLYFHGGGFVVGGLESHDDVCAEIAAGCGLPLISVDYRLAPEHVFPAALDDVWAVYRNLLEEGREVILVGDSAGATLCAAVCRRALRLGEPQPVRQVLIYPALALGQDLPSYRENADAPLLTAADCTYYHAVYRGDAEIVPELLPELAPLAADSFAGLAPAWVVTADIDPIRDDGREYVARLQAAGVPADWRNEEQLVHSYLRARHRSRRAAASFAAIVAAVAAS